MLRLSGSTQNHFDGLDKQINHCREFSKKNSENFFHHGMKGNLVSITSNKYHNPQEPITVRIISCPRTNFSALLLEANSEQTTTSNLKNVEDNNHQSIRVGCGIDISDNVKLCLTYQPILEICRI